LLIIRQEQMAALAAYTRRAFRKRMIEHLRRDFPRRALELGPEGVAALVDGSIQRALGYGIDDEDDLRAFIDQGVVPDGPFEEQPGMEWAQEILRKSSLSGHAKMQLVRRLR
jgi:hypothetical protein